MIKSRGSNWRENFAAAAARNCLLTRRGTGARGGGSIRAERLSALADLIDVKEERKISQSLRGGTGLGGRGGSSLFSISCAGAAAAGPRRRRRILETLSAGYAAATVEEPREGRENIKRTEREKWKQSTIKGVGSLAHPLRGSPRDIKTQCGCKCNVKFECKGVMLVMLPDVQINSFLYRQS